MQNASIFTNDFGSLYEIQSQLFVNLSYKLFDVHKNMFGQT